MPLLYYWRWDNYIRDRAFGFGYHLNQNSAAMLQVQPGDSLWAFTRREPDKQYVLAAEMVVRAVTRNSPNYRYGAYRIWGDLRRSRYFAVDLAPRAEPLIRALSISASAPVLGRSFQGHAAVRNINEVDHQLLTTFSSDLREMERVGIYPEDEWEAQLVHGEPARPLVVREQAAEYSRRVEYLYQSVDIQRMRRYVEELQSLYDGRCQICMYDPRTRYGHRLCHGHHIQWLSRGGEDALENMMLVCANHHTAIHRDDAPFDYATLAFTFSNGLEEPLRLNTHLLRAA